MNEVPVKMKSFSILNLLSVSVCALTVSSQGSLNESGGESGCVSTFLLPDDDSRRGEEMTRRRERRYEGRRGAAIRIEMVGGTGFLLLMLTTIGTHGAKIALFPSTGCFSHDVMMKQASLLCFFSFLSVILSLVRFDLV